MSPGLSAAARGSGRVRSLGNEKGRQAPSVLLRLCSAPRGGRHRSDSAANSKQKVPLRHRQLVGRLADEKLAVGPHVVGFRVDLDLRRRAAQVTRLKERCAKRAERRAGKQRWRRPRPSSSLNSTSAVVSSSGSTTAPTWPRTSPYSGRSWSSATALRKSLPRSFDAVGAAITRPSRLRSAESAHRSGRSRLFLPRRAGPVARSATSICHRSPQASPGSGIAASCAAAFNKSTRNSVASVCPMPSASRNTRALCRPRECAGFKQ